MPKIRDLAISTIASNQPLPAGTDWFVGVIPPEDPAKCAGTEDWVIPPKDPGKCAGTEDWVIQPPDHGKCAGTEDWVIPPPNPDCGQSAPPKQKNKGGVPEDAVIRMKQQLQQRVKRHVHT